MRIKKLVPGASRAYGDLIDTMIEVKIKTIDIGIDEYDRSVLNGTIRGEKIVLVREGENFGYIKTQNNLYRC